MNFKKYYKPSLIKMIIFIIPVFLFVWLAEKQLVLSGNLSSEYGFGQKPSIIDELSPTSRTENPEKNLKTDYTYQRINDEPVYFDVNVPKIFRTAKISLIYSNTSRSIVEMGIKRSDLEFDYEFKTLQNKYIDNIEKGWNKIKSEDGKIILAQKKSGAVDVSEDGDINRQYESIEEFLNDIPKGKNIASYKIDILKDQKLEGYEKSDKTNEINQYLRGSHKINTYIKDEDLDFDFSYYDINRSEGPDRFNVNVFYGENKVFADTIQDDKNEHANGVSSKGECHLKIPGLPEGKYVIELEVSDDIFIDKIKTKQKYIVFEGKLFLAGNDEYREIPDIKTKETTFFGKGEIFTAKTFHPSGNQELTIDNKAVLLNSENKDYKTVELDSDDDLRTIVSPKNDIIISSQYFVFDKDQYFDPNFGINHQILQEVGGIESLDYIIAKVGDYTSPSKKGEWYQKEIEFDVSDLKKYTDDGKLSFILSMPGSGSINNFKIRELKVTLEKDPVWVNFFPRLKNYITSKF